MNEREARRCQLTLNSLQGTPEDVKLFKPVGRAFLGVSRDDFKEDTEQEIQKLNNDTPKVRQNRDEMARRKANAEKELQDMIVGLQRRKAEGRAIS